jgi:hypothetical protein
MTPTESGYADLITAKSPAHRGGCPTHRHNPEVGIYVHRDRVGPKGWAGAPSGRDVTKGKSRIAHDADREEDVDRPSPSPA